MRPMPNFPPPDGSMQSRDLQDETPGPASGVDASDLELVRRAQRGERGAFDLLVLRYQHKVIKLVARLLRDPTEAEDVSQEAFVKAYRALGSFRGDSAFYTWLYRIAVNTARNAMASRQRRPLDYEAELSEGEQSTVESRLRHTDTPEATVLSEEIRETVNRASMTMKRKKYLTWDRQTMRLDVDAMQRLLTTELSVPAGERRQPPF